MPLATKENSLAKSRRTLLGLRVEALRIARSKRHDLQWLPPEHGELRSTQRGFCETCTADVQLTTKTSPKEQPLSGDALTTRCRKLRIAIVVKK